MTFVSYIYKYINFKLICAIIKAYNFLLTLIYFAFFFFRTFLKCYIIVIIFFLGNTRRWLWSVSDGVEALVSDFHDDVCETRQRNCILMAKDPVSCIRKPLWTELIKKPLGRAQPSFFLSGEWAAVNLLGLYDMIQECACQISQTNELSKSHLLLSLRATFFDDFSVPQEY